MTLLTTLDFLYLTLAIGVIILVAAIGYLIVRVVDTLSRVDDILEDIKGITLYKKYRREKPDLDIEDWKGLAAVRKSK